MAYYDDPEIHVRVYEHALTWWAQIDGTFCAGRAFKIGDGRARAIRKAVGEWRAAERRQQARDRRAEEAEVVVVTADSPR